MKWGDIKEFAVRCGPGEVRYHITDDGELTVYVGEYVKDAPPDAEHCRVYEGYTTFVIKTVETHSA